MTNWPAWMACGLLMSLPAAAPANIFRWDNGQLIPGTHAITPGPALQLGARGLQFAELSNTNLTGSSFYDRSLGGSDLTGARFTNANLSYTELSGSKLSGTDFAGATVIGTRLYGAGFTNEQLYSTASYQAKDLHEIAIGGINLTRWDFSGQDLTGADFGSSTLTSADLTGSNLTNAGLWRATLTNANFNGAVVAGANFLRGYGLEGSGITLPQLYSTASYQQRGLRGIGLSSHDLTGGDFSGQDLTGADLGGSNLANANLSGTNLTNARLSGGCSSECLDAADLTNADLSGAVVAGADFSFFNNEFSGFRGSGITLPQLYSTASYGQRNLPGIGLRNHDLTDWDFSGQDLSGASLEGSTLTSAHFAGAAVAGADFSIFAHYFGFASIEFLGSGITITQLYSTASYQQRNLRGIGLRIHDLTGWDFSGQDLTDADFFDSALTNANFAGAMVTGANFGAYLEANYGSPSRGFTKEQLYSTASYQQRNLRGIGLNRIDLTGWDFNGQDLAGADFGSSTLYSANFAGAMVTGASFPEATWRGFTKEQLYSTASYQQRNLRGIGLSYNDLTGWDFSGQDLTGAFFWRSSLTNANLSGTNLSNARLGGSCGFECIGAADLTNADLSGANLTNAALTGATLTNADLSGAVVAGADFSVVNYFPFGVYGSGITLPQLYSTASYQQKDLRGIGLENHDLTGGDFSGQDLTGVDFLGSTLTNASFSFADLRGAVMPSEPIQLTRNTIRAFGAINGLDLEAGETLVVRDSNIGISVNDSMNAVSGGTLELVLGDADWGSTMAVAAGVTPDLGGTLRVRFADRANLASMLGTTFDFFDWPGVLETNNRFDAIELPPGTQWDFSQLYMTGTAQLTAIPEPSTVLLLTCAAAAYAMSLRHCRPPSQSPPAFCW